VAVWWLVVPLIVVNAFAGVRLYVLQHDCGHGSLYSTKRANDLAGHGLSVFTLTPYRVMQFNHNEHHSHLGNLEERDTTEIFTMTLREWEQADFWTRLKYRLYRNPLLMIPVGGLLTYVLRLSLAEERPPDRRGGRDRPQYRARALDRRDLVDGRGNRA
jgi:omega-6 fatty acid desaturase (delta-12 desaturase)